MDVVLPLLSTSVTLVFAISVLLQYFRRRKVYQLVWGVALIMFAIGTGAELVGGIWGWSLLPYQLWWIFGAFFTAAYLGQGTIYLLTPRWFANLTMAILLAASAFGIYLVLTAPIDPASFDLINAKPRQMRLPDALTQGRFLTMPFNIYGTIALVGGALYSAIYFWSKKAMGTRALANVLIAVGTLIIGAGGGISKAGYPDALFVAELVGVIIIFAGFLKMK